ncbi:MAG: sulfite exporter TauE/SafE family protein [Oscillospiraceae bacterium]|nr:sulfite exporter TauE/SafE family protein [Oscillospiraceae bacterium]
MFTTKYVLFLLVVMLAMFIQSLVGFGGNPIAMPLGIILVGVGLAKPVMTILAGFIGIVVAVREYKYINWRELFKMCGVMLVGVILGLWVFKSVKLDFLIIAYALVVIAIGVKKLFFPSEKEASDKIKYTALGLAGLMQGLFVSGGSFLAVYSVAKLKDKQEFRATSNAVWGILNTFMLITYFFDGTMNREVALTSAICIVPTMVIAWLAGKLSRKINKQTFLKLAYIIIIISGAVLLISNI